MPKSLLPKRRRLTLTLVALILALKMVQVGALCAAQETLPMNAADPRIAAAIRQVSADRVRQTIETLVSFGNRSTISAQDEASIKTGKGIGAAREWIKAEFDRYSKECGGCLEVKTDSFVQQP